jgi:hypothetical protein
MRGLLGFLVVAFVTFAGLAVVAVQLVLPAVVAAAIEQSSFIAGQPATVRVETSLTGVLLHGQIDRVTIEADGLREGIATIGHASATLTDVGLATRAFTDVEGVLSGVALAAPDGSAVSVERVTLSGSSGGIAAVGEVSAAALATLLAAQLQDLKVTAAQVQVGDGAIRLQLFGRPVVARLVIDEGSLVIDTTTEFGRIPILRAPADGAWRFTAVALSAAGARLTAEIAAP